MKTQGLKRTINKFELYDEKIALAVSGGVDSMCLALLMQQYSKVENIEIICLIVDHQLRAESTQEALYVSDLLSGKGIKNLILTWEHDGEKSNIMDKARQARYRLILDYCHQNNIKYIMTGHHKDDQAETVLQRIQRGTGIKGLVAIKECSVLEGVKIIRPLLKYSKVELKNIMLENSWKWVEDPSNANEKYGRVQIRNIIEELPDSQMWIERLSLLAENAQRAEVALERMAKKELRKCVKFYGSCYAILDPKLFKELDVEIAFRIINKVVKNFTQLNYSQRLDGIKEVYEHITNNSQLCKTLGHCEFRRHKLGFLIFREARNPFLQSIDKIKNANWKIIQSSKETVVCVKPLGNRWSEISEFMPQLLIQKMGQSILSTRNAEDEILAIDINCLS